MEKSTSYIEELFKKIAADKSRLAALIFSLLSAVCLLMYLTTVALSGIHLIFILSMLAGTITSILYLLNVDDKWKFTNDCLAFGVAALIVGLLLKVVKVGTIFSVEYFIGYFIYEIAFVLFALYCAKNVIKPKVIKILLVVCAGWSLFEFFNINAGILWKIFRVAEAFLAIAYIFILNILEMNIIENETNILFLFDIEKIELYAKYDFKYNPRRNGWQKVYQKKPIFAREKV